MSTGDAKSPESGRADMKDDIAKVYTEFECDDCGQTITLRIGAPEDERVYCGCPGTEWYLRPARVRREEGKLDLLDFRAKDVELHR